MLDIDWSFLETLDAVLIMILLLSSIHSNGVIACNLTFLS